MPTISEILAAKKAAAAGNGYMAPPAKVQAYADNNGLPPRQSLAALAAEKAEDKADDDLLTRLSPAPLGKSRPSLVLSKDLPATTPNGEPRGQATPITDGPPRRSLSETQGEGIPATPITATPMETLWHLAMTGFESELCLMTDPVDAERAWLAVRFTEDHPPILLHALPIYQHPRTVRPANEPF
jgi:hypothetical protein